MHAKSLLIQQVKYLVFIILLAFPGLFASAQYAMPEVMDTATFKQQMDYIQEKTRIYNDFRAIREDIFQRMKRNSLDSLADAKQTISSLNASIVKKDDEIGNLNRKLNSTEEQRDEAIKNKDSLSFLGIQMDKKFYNSLMWIIVAVLAVMLVVLFIIFRQNRVITVECRDDLEETKEAFENYKKEARERYEKLVVSHHAEIMKLKGK